MPPRMDNHTLSLIVSERVPPFDWDSFSSSDWNTLIQMAHQEGMGPLLYWKLSRSGRFSSLPESARNFLRALYAGAWAQNHKIFRELEILSRLFHQAGIQTVVLKGACLALTVYPDIGLRPMGDLDILVPASQLPEAVRIAKSRGYVEAEPEAAPGLRDLLNHEVCLQRIDSPSVVLEIHHSLVADKTFSYAVPVDWFWEQTEPLDGSSQMRFENLLMLTPTAQTLYAACHAMLQHGGQNTPLRWYYDLDRLIRHYDGRMDWKLLLLQAKKFEWGSALDAALSQTCAYFDTPVPDLVRADLAEGSDRHRELVALKQSHPETHILLERQTLLSLNWNGRFRLALALLIPTPAYMRWRYKLKNSWSLPVYYLFRWWGIFKDAIRTMTVLLKRSPLTRP